MKKLLLASALVLGLSTSATAFQPPQIEAQAKEYAMKSSFAASLKKGTMPYAKGKLGMSYRTLKQKAKKQKMWYEDGLVYYAHERAKNDPDIYIFDEDYFSNSSKVLMMGRQYDYLISTASIQKYFGKGEKLNSTDRFYMSGKYYLIVSKNTSTRKTLVFLGLSDAIFDLY